MRIFARLMGRLLLTGWSLISLLLIQTLGTIPPFHGSDYVCQRGFGRKFVSAGLVSRTSQIRRPQFFECGPNETRDHILELQLAKSYLQEGGYLSCLTIDWLNTDNLGDTSNMRCVSRELNTLKGQLFHELLSATHQGCDKRLQQLFPVSLACLLGANITHSSEPCKGIPLWKGLGKKLCCHVDSFHASIFVQVARSSLLPYEIRQDIWELRRFLQYKIQVFCQAPKSTDSQTSQSPSSPPQAPFYPVFGESPVFTRMVNKVLKKPGNKRRGGKQQTPRVYRKSREGGGRVSQGGGRRGGGGRGGGGRGGGGRGGGGRGGGRRGR